MLLISKSNKLLVFLLVLSYLFSFLSITTANKLDFKLKSESAVLMDFNSGKIIYQKNAHKKLPPASITKIMTMLLIMESIEEGRIKLTDKIIVSEHAANMGGSQIWLEVGEEMKVEELLKAVAIVSANDACVAIAEHIYGTEEEFIVQMNQRATELGMKDTKFYNTNGLPIKEEKIGNYTTAYDVALMTRELVTHPKILDYTSRWIDHLREGDSFLRNTNKLVRFYDGADGIKTGYTTEAGFCLSATAEKKGLRFISVIMKAPSSQVRFNESKKLLSSAFSIYRPFKVVKKDEVITKIKVFKGKKQQVEIVPNEELTISVLRGSEDNLLQRIILKKEVTAPLKKDEKLGQLFILKDEDEIGKVDLVAAERIRKANYFEILINLWGDFINNLIE